jgi:hypothetical protein
LTYPKGQETFLGKPLMPFENDHNRIVWLIVLALYVALAVIGCHWFLSPFF